MTVNKSLGLFNKCGITDCINSACVHSYVRNFACMSSSSLAAAAAAIWVHCRTKFFSILLNDPLDCTSLYRVIPANSTVSSLHFLTDLFLLHLLILRRYFHWPFTSIILPSCYVYCQSSNFVFDSAYISHPIGLVGKVFVDGSGDRGSIPRRVIPKTQKMVFDPSLLSIQHYMIWIKDKVEQSRERSSAFSCTSVS